MAVHKEFAVVVAVAVVVPEVQKQPKRGEACSTMRDSEKLN